MNELYRFGEEKLYSNGGRSIFKLPGTDYLFAFKGVDRSMAYTGLWL